MRSGSIWKMKGTELLYIVNGFAHLDALSLTHSPNPLDILLSCLSCSSPSCLRSRTYSLLQHVFLTCIPFHLTIYNSFPPTPPYHFALKSHTSHSVSFVHGLCYTKLTICSNFRAVCHFCSSCIFLHLHGIMPVFVVNRPRRRTRGFSEEYLGTVTDPWLDGS